ncbi:aldose 1-epimerase family protein [Chloroflexota bacterium]
MWSRATIEQHSVDIRQFIDFRQATLADGQRVIEAYNSSGLTCTLLPDRGLDIWLAAYNGHPLTWISQGAPHGPDTASGWLRQFNGGMLTTCGLTHAGPPETDAATGEFRDLHGRYTFQPVGEVSIVGEWVTVDGVEKYELRLTGVIAEAVLFGEQLRLERTYKLTLGEPTIELVDVVRNIGDLATPLMLVYHCNFGYPLVAADTRLHVAGAGVYPRDEAAAPGLERWADYEAPLSGYAEQVFFHHVKVGLDGWSEALLAGNALTLAVQWDAKAMPYLTQWKNTRAGVYVCGVEPGNCIPEGQNAARAAGRLQILEPGAVGQFGLRLKVLADDSTVEAGLSRIATLQSDGQAVSGCLLDDFAG